MQIGKTKARDHLSIYRGRGSIQGQLGEVSATSRSYAARGQEINALIQADEAEILAIQEQIEAIDQALEEVRQESNEDRQARIKKNITAVGNLQAKIDGIEERIKTNREQLTVDPAKAAKDVTEMFARISQTKDKGKQVEQRRRLKSLIADCVEAIELNPGNFIHSRHKKTAYLTIMLRSDHKLGMQYYGKGKQIFLALLVHVDRKQILIWNRNEGMRASAGYRVDRETWSVEEIRPHSSAITFEDEGNEPSPPMTKKARERTLAHFNCRRAKSDSSEPEKR